MERGFGADFARVRVHDDGDSYRLAADIRARAFTYRDHVFFGRGQFQPSSTQGRHLLAHELAHVVQQRGARIEAPQMKEDDDGSSSGPFEDDADGVADAAVEGPEADATEMESGRTCHSSQRLDFNTTNYRNITFPVRRPCTTATVVITARYICELCGEQGPSSYTIVMDGRTTRRMQSGTQERGNECPGSPAVETRQVFPVSPGQHTLRINAGPVENCTLDTRGWLRIR
jgi:hypothetical protein